MLLLVLYFLLESQWKNVFFSTYHHISLSYFYLFHDADDWKYIHGRAQMLVDDLTGEDTVELQNLGRMEEGGGSVVERDLSSNAFGQNSFFLLDVPGVMQIDLLQWFRKNRNMESYR